VRARSLSLLRVQRQTDWRACLRRLALADRFGVGASTARRRTVESARARAGRAPTVPAESKGYMWRLQPRLDEPARGDRSAGPEGVHPGRAGRDRSDRCGSRRGMGPEDGTRGHAGVVREEGTRLVVDFAEWINKSSGRGTISIGIANGQSQRTSKIALDTRSSGGGPHKEGRVGADTLYGASNSPRRSFTRSAVSLSHRVSSVTVRASS